MMGVENTYKKKFESTVNMYINLLNENYFLVSQCLQLTFIYLLSEHLAMSSSFVRYISSNEGIHLKFTVTVWFVYLLI